MEGVDGVPMANLEVKNMDARHGRVCEGLAVDLGCLYSVIHQIDKSKILVTQL
jgi:hypothetical protein